MLSIQAFSQKTGIPKSTLRFYEEKGLLVPERHVDNGYRLYRPEQVELALFISSLRLANISLKDIQRYVVASDSEKNQMKQMWSRTLKAQKELLEVQIKYLESSHEDKEIFLFERPAERIVWFYVEGNQGEFGHFFLKGQEELKKHHITFHNSYLKYVSGRKYVKAWIGFGIEESTDITNLQLFEKEEKLGKSLCVATQYPAGSSKIEKAYQKLLRYVSDHQYFPTGSLLEMYQGNDLSRITILIPVMKIGGEENEAKAKR